MCDQKLDNFKKYRIPAPNNPRYEEWMYRRDLREYGGEESQEFQNLVLGKHGSPTFTLIPYEVIERESYNFYNYRYSQDDKTNGKSYTDKFQTPKIPSEYAYNLVAAIDLGYSDPTIIQVFGQDKHGVWRLLLRYRLTRIPFPEQAAIIDWLDTFYHFNYICLDIGSGGSGAAVIQMLQSDQFSKAKKYKERLMGVLFNDSIIAGLDPSGNELKLVAKSYGSQQLSKMIHEKELRLSEIDYEGISQLVRLTAERLSSGDNRYFIMSDTGKGKASDDHIYASFVVFMICLTKITFTKKRRLSHSANWG